MKRFLKRIGILFIVLVFGTVSLVYYKGYQMYKAAITEAPLEIKVNEILDNPDFVATDHISQLFLDATVVTEDERFHKRSGVLDIEALGRAIWVNVSTFSAREGGSTIPQQVAKNLYFQDDFSLPRKIAEYYVARDLIRYYSKDDILGMYVNMNYYGDGHHGIKQASEGYFGVPSDSLNNAQATLLAGIVQAPAYYQLSTNLEGARERQVHVLYRLVDQGFITQEQGDAIYEIPLEIKE